MKANEKNTVCAADLANHKDISYMQKAMQQVRSALDQLEVIGDVCIFELNPGDTSRFEVAVNGEYFGIFDTGRNTFVD